MFSLTRLIGVRQHHLHHTHICHQNVTMQAPPRGVAQENSLWVWCKTMPLMPLHSHMTWNLSVPPALLTWQASALVIMLHQQSPSLLFEAEVLTAGLGRKVSCRPAKHVGQPKPCQSLCICCMTVLVLAMLAECIPSVGDSNTQQPSGHWGLMGAEELHLTLPNQGLFSEKPRWWSTEPMPDDCFPMGHVTKLCCSQHEVFIRADRTGPDNQTCRSDVAATAMSSHQQHVGISCRVALLHLTCAYNFCFNGTEVQGASNTHQPRRRWTARAKELRFILGGPDLRGLLSTQAGPTKRERQPSGPSSLPPFNL